MVTENFLKQVAGGKKILVKRGMVVGLLGNETRYYRSRSRKNHMADCINR